MVSTEQISRGVGQYLDREIIPHFEPWKGLAIGTAAALYLRQLPAMLNKLPQSMKLVDDSGMVDDDALFDAVKSAMHDQISVDLPIIGRMTFDSQEIDKVFRYIRGL